MHGVKTADDMPICIVLMELYQRKVHAARNIRQNTKINWPVQQQGTGENNCWAAFTRGQDMFGLQEHGQTFGHASGVCRSFFIQVDNVTNAPGDMSCRNSF